MLAHGTADRCPTLRRAVSAGEHLPAADWHAFHEATGVRLIDGIGATEMLHIFISAADDDIRPGSTGRAGAGLRRRGARRGRQAVPDGTPGRLAVKGPTGCRYLADDRQTAYVRNGWNITGDTFMPRRGRLLLVPGPQRRHDHLGRLQHRGAGGRGGAAAHPDVAECGVVGAPDEARGTIVKAFVVLRDGVAGDDGEGAGAAGLREEQIAPYKYPRASSSSPRCRAPRPASSSASGSATGLPGLTMAKPAPRQLIVTLYGLYARASTAGCRSPPSSG